MDSTMFSRDKWKDWVGKHGLDHRLRKEVHDFMDSTNDSTLVLRVRQLWDYFNSKKVTGWDKAVVVAALLYIVSPVDLAPDWLPILGWLDDLGVAAIALNHILAQIDRKGTGKKRKKDGKKKKKKGDHRSGILALN